MYPSLLENHGSRHCPGKEGRFDCRRGKGPPHLDKISLETQEIRRALTYAASQSNGEVRDKMIRFLCEADPVSSATRSVAAIGRMWSEDPEVYLPAIQEMKCMERFDGCYNDALAEAQKHHKSKAFERHCEGLRAANVACRLKSLKGLRVLCCEGLRLPTEIEDLVRDCFLNGSRRDQEPILAFLVLRASGNRNTFHLFVTVDGKVARVYDESGRELAKTDRSAAYGLTVVDALPHGGFVAGSDEMRVIIFNEFCQELARTIDHPVNTVAVLPHGGFVTGSNDWISRVFDDSGQEISNTKKHERNKTVTAIRNGKGILAVSALAGGGFVAGGSDGLATVFDGKCHEIGRTPYHDGPVCAVAGLRGGGFATGSHCSARVFSKQGTPLISTTNHVVQAVAALPSGGFVTGSFDQCARIFNELGEELARTEEETEAGIVNRGILSVTAFHDGSFVTGSADRIARVFSDSGELLACTKAHKNGILAVVALASAEARPKQPASEASARCA